MEPHRPEPEEILNGRQFDDIRRQEYDLLKSFYLYVDSNWAMGMLTDKVDEVITGYLTPKPSTKEPDNDKE